MSITSSPVRYDLFDRFSKESIFADCFARFRNGESMALVRMLHYADKPVAEFLLEFADYIDQHCRFSTAPGSVNFYDELDYEIENVSFLMSCIVHKLHKDAVPLAMRYIMNCKFDSCRDVASIIISDDSFHIGSIVMKKIIHIWQHRQTYIRQHNSGINLSRPMIASVWHDDARSIELSKKTIESMTFRQLLDISSDKYQLNLWYNQASYTA
jgi:hypothetical protein